MEEGSEFVFQKMPIDEIKQLGDKRFNSLNHWENNKAPADYQDNLAQFLTSKWIDKFHLSYSVINIPDMELLWMKDACAIGRQTGEFPRLYREDLDDFVAKYGSRYFDGNKPFFVRSEEVSLKAGVFGVGPYTNIRNVIISSVTADSTHTPLTPTTQHLKFYLMEWLNINSHKEFRVFVHENKITAISQQKWYEENSILKPLTMEEQRETLTRWGKIILKYFEEKLRKLITHVSNYTIDIAILDNDTPYFIEINPFGKQYAAGSSLFHWLIDEEILYGLGKENKVFFRYV